MPLSPAFDPATSLLLGEGHQHLVGDLLKRLEDICNGRTDVPRVVLLTGEQGTGKSRVVREVYRALQAAQPTPAYWPALPEDDAATGHGSGVDPLPNRKRLGPDTNTFLWPAGALPVFTWWTFECQRTGGGPLMSAVEQAKPELRLHLGPAMWSLAKTRGHLEKLANQSENAMARAREAGQEGVVEGLQWLISEVGGPSIPGLSLVLDWAKRAADSGRRFGDAKRMAESDVSFGGLAGQARQTLGEEFARLVRATTHPQQPAVVIIEDAHWMDEGLVEFLKFVSVRAPNQPVLVIATGWPHPKPNPPYDSWRRWATALGALETIVVPDLDTASLTTLVRRAAPNTSDTDAQLITAKYTNPLALRLFLGLRHVRSAARRRDGAIRVVDVDLDHFPADIEELYEKRADEWSHHVVTALEYAAGTLPSQWTVGPYLPDAVVAAVSTVPMDGCDSTADGLAQAVRHGITVPAAGLHSFREVLIADLMRRRLNPIERDELQTAVTTELRRRIAEARSDRYLIPDPNDHLLHAARWLTELNTHTATVEDAVALIATAVALAEVYRFAEAAALLAEPSWTVHLPAHHPDTLIARHSYAFWLGRAGRVREAAVEFQGLLNDFLPRLGHDHPFILTMRHNLATMLGESGRTEDAVVELKAVLADRTRVLGADHLSTLAARDKVAFWLGEGGRLEDALVEAQAVLADRMRVLGADHPDTLASRQTLAAMMGKAGRIEAALAESQALLADRLKMLGDEHPDTFSTRHTVAGMLGEAVRRHPG